MSPQKGNYLKGHVPPNRKLFGGTVPPNSLPRINTLVWKICITPDSFLIYSLKQPCANETFLLQKCWTILDINWQLMTDWGNLIHKSSILIIHKRTQLSKNWKHENIYESIGCIWLYLSILKYINNVKDYLTTSINI